MAATRRAPNPTVGKATDKPPAFEPAAVIELEELRAAERDPRVKARLKKAVEEGERIEREGRGPW